MENIFSGGRVYTTNWLIQQVKGSATGHNQNQLNLFFGSFTHSFKLFLFADFEVGQHLLCTFTVKIRIKIGKEI